MSTIIIYGSCYGSTEFYAKELSKRTGIKAVEYSKADNLDSYDTIVYMGGMYAGKVLGLTKTIKRFPPKENQQWLIVTVGFGNPESKTTVDRTRAELKSQISQQLFERAQIFHLRGKIDYSTMSLLHRIMMMGLCSFLKKTPAEKRDADSQEIIDCYNSKADFIDLDSLYEIEHVLRS